jgi:hypothetical protein
MKAIATQVSPTKERIEIVHSNGDREVVVKRVDIGKWAFVPVVESSTGNTFIGKSRTRDAADKWLPFPQTVTCTLRNYGYGRVIDGDADAIAAFKAKYPEAVKVRTSGRGWRADILKVDLPYSRTVLTVQR